MSVNIQTIAVTPLNPIPVVVENIYTVTSDWLIACKAHYHPLVSVNKQTIAGTPLNPIPVVVENIYTVTSDWLIVS